MLVQGGLDSPAQVKGRLRQIREELGMNEGTVHEASSGDIDPSIGLRRAVLAGLALRSR
jgi:hypothetical protein